MKPILALLDLDKIRMPGNDLSAPNPWGRVKPQDRIIRIAARGIVLMVAGTLVLNLTGTASTVIGALLIVAGLIAFVPLPSALSWD